MLRYCCYCHIIIVKAQEVTLGEHTRNFNVLININKNGTIDVKETIVYDFDDLNRHGIYRNIPYIKKNQEGNKFKLGLQILSVTDKKGQAHHYSETEENDNIKIKIGDADKTINGIHTFVINYQVEEVKGEEVGKQLSFFNINASNGYRSHNGMFSW